MKDSIRIIFIFEKLSLICGGQAITLRLTKGGWTLQKGMAVKKGRINK